MSEFKPPTHKITTPFGKIEVELKDFISGFDDEAIESIYTRGRHKITPQDPSNPTKAPANDLEIDGASIQDAEREGVKRVVVSVGGVAGSQDENLDAIYNMRKEDTQFVKKAVDKVINPPEDNPAKKNKG